MNTVNIQVAQVQPPALGKKRGKVIDTGNNAYQAGLPLLNQFQPGGSYTIRYKDDMFNGFSFKVIEAAQPVGTGGPVQGQGALPMASPPQQTRLANTQTGRGYGNDPQMAERIFVCGAFNAALGNPNITPTALTEDQLASMVNNLRRVWSRTFGGKPSVGDDMNDEIPFNHGQGQIPAQQATGEFE